MNRRDIFPVSIFETGLPEPECDRIIEVMAGVEFRGSRISKDFVNISVDTFLHRSIPDLATFIEFANAQLWSMVGTPDTKLVTTECWANLSYPGQRHNEHFHSNSIASGILYLNDSPDGTRFFADNPWMHRHLDPIDDVDSMLQFETRARKGKAVMFPSSLVHRVSANASNYNRLTIAWNAFPSGRFRKPGSLSYLNLEVKP